VTCDAAHNRIAQRGAFSSPLPLSISSIVEFSTMRQASFSATIDSSTPAISRKAPTRKSLLLSLLQALHCSRRLQTRRVLAQYRHLIARPETADAKSKAAGSAYFGD
jgi:hypothetical protein